MPVKKGKMYLFSSGPSNPSGWAPLDSTTYYLTFLGYSSTTDGFWKAYFPTNGIIKQIQLLLNPSSGLATAEDVTCYLRVNTTDYPLGTTKFNVQTVNLVVPLNIPITTGDFVQLKLVTPAWVTNPTGIVWNWNLLISTA